MKKTLSLLTLAITLLFVSCKKEKIDQPVQPPVTVSKKLVNSTANGDVDFTYNADGTLAKFVRKSGANTWTCHFTYTAGKVNYKAYFNNKITEDQIGEFTMVNGKATKHDWTYYDAHGNIIKTYNEVLTYNAKGLLEKHENGYWAYIFSYDNNDNMTAWIEHDAQGQPVLKSEFTYTNKKDLFPAFGYFHGFISGFFIPAKSKNLPASQKITNLLTSTVTYNGTIDYDFDNDGYVAKGYWHSIFPSGQDYNWTNTFQ